MLDRRVREEGPVLRREQLLEIALEPVGTVWDRRAEAVGEPLHVRIHEDGGLPERRAEDDVGRLAPDPGERHESVHAVRDLIAMLLRYGVGDPLDGAGLLAEEAGRLDE